MAGLGCSMIGAIQLPIGFSQYLSKANLPKPPKETISHKIKERIKSSIPSSEPIPLPN